MQNVTELNLAKQGSYKAAVRKRAGGHLLDDIAEDTTGHNRRASNEDDGSNHFHGDATVDKDQSKNRANGAARSLRQGSHLRPKPGPKVRALGQHSSCSTV